MSRQSTAGQRLLTPTEELEKYEQAITLVLQEIDHNFSRALGIVTSKILPVLEKYGQHSGDVWENSKFWKLFFENSANVSLSGYEEVPEDETTITEGEAGDHEREEEAEEDHTILTNTDTDGNDADLLSQSTPTSRTETSSFMQTPAGNAYTGQQTAATPGSETPRPGGAKRRAKGSSSHGAQSGNTTPRRTRTPAGRAVDDPPPSTPRAQTFGGSDEDELTLSSMTPELPTFAPDTARKMPGSRGKQRSHQKQRNGPVLHPNVLGHSYRIQSTPLGGGRSYGASTTSYRPGSRGKPQTPVRDKTTGLDIDLDSSPMEEAPVLRAGLLPTPGRNKGKRLSGVEWAAQRTRDRVPGVSVLAGQSRPGTGEESTASGDMTASRRRRSSLHRVARESLGAAAGGNTFALARAGAGGGWASDSDDDDYDGGFAGMSPPKTMAFNVPTTGAGGVGGRQDGGNTGRLFRTPAKEASTKIVEGLLAMAGAQNLSDEEGEEGLDSPSVVGRGINFEEDTF